MQRNNTILLRSEWAELHQIGKNMLTRSSNAPLSQRRIYQFLRPCFHGQLVNELCQIWGGDKALAFSAPFGMQRYCFVSKLERFELNWGRNQKSNFALFTPILCKN